jgi:hypothetical protein
MPFSCEHDNLLSGSTSNFIFSVVLKQQQNGLETDQIKGV